MKLIVIITLFFQLPKIAFCQDNFSYYEVIKDDSIMLFFNDKDKFVEKECAFGIRFTRVDADANFNGLFTDAYSKLLLSIQSNAAPKTKLTAALFTLVALWVLISIT